MKYKIYKYTSATGRRYYNGFSSTSGLASFTKRYNSATEFNWIDACAAARQLKILGYDCTIEDEIGGNTWSVQNGAPTQIKE